VIEQEGIHIRIKAGDALEVESTTIKNPVTGADVHPGDVHPGVVLPEGIVVKRADLGASKVFCLKDAISLDHSGQYTAVGPFEYRGP
jgi:hypothetical protein